MLPVVEVFVDCPDVVEFVAVVVVSFVVADGGLPICN